MSKLVSRSGVGAALSAAQYDSNLDIHSGINESQIGLTYTVDSTDQDRTIEISNAAAVAVTLEEIATIAAAIDTSDFKVTLLNIGVGDVTITPDAADSINTGASTIVLATDESAIIQTDSTGLIWNILNSGVDVATKTGIETLTNKTLASPTLNTPTLESPVINTEVSGDAGVARLKQSATTATTSGTSVDITGIPDWAKVIHIQLNQVSSSGVFSPNIRLGDSGGIEATGYNAGYTKTSAIASAVANSNDSGFVAMISALAGDKISGILTLVLADDSTNTWVGSGSFCNHFAVAADFCAASGEKSLSGTLDRIQLVENGAGAFDNGSIRVTYEG